jgi:hypothetical protein
MTSTTTGSGIAHAIGTDGLFSLSLRSGSARLRAVDGDTLRVRDRGQHDLAAMFTIDLGEGSAALRAVNGSTFGGGRHSPDLDIDVPRQATIVVDAASGDLDATGTLGDQRYRTASGEVTLEGVSGRIAVEAVSGDVDLVATGEAHLTVRTVSGDVRLRAETIASLDVATTSGDLRMGGRLDGSGPFGIVTVSGDVQLAPTGDVRIELASLSGDLRSEIGGAADGSRGRRVLTVGKGGPLLAVRSLSGDVDVVRPRADADESTAAIAASGSPTPPTQAPDIQAPSNGNAQVADPTDEDPHDVARRQIIGSLERGEIDVAEAGRRLDAIGASEARSNDETTRVATDGSTDA